MLLDAAVRRSTRPSERTLNGKAHDSEFHFVHKDAADSIAVVGFFLEQKPLSKTDSSVSSVLDGLRRTNTTHSWSADASMTDC